jgi:hypothetical protein
MKCDVADCSLSRGGWLLAVAVAGVVLASRVDGGSSAFAQAAAQPGGDTAPQPSAESPKEVPKTPAVSETTPAKKEKKSSSKGDKPAKSAARLPAYFSAVVTEEQRQKIYAIQKDYEGRIDPLRRQLESLVKERDQKVNAVLTPEQRQKIESLKAAKKPKPPKNDAKKPSPSAAKSDPETPAKQTQ